MQLEVIHSPEQRLALWREFRDSLQEQPIITQLELVTTFFIKMPLFTWYIDEDDKETWPTVWELIHEGGFSRSSMAYIMLETLTINNPDVNKSDFDLLYIHDDITNEKFMILRYNKTQQVLNYDWGNIVHWKDICNNVQVLKTYS